MTLEDSLRLFEEGVKLSAVCKAELEEAEGRVMVLVEGKGGKVGVAEIQLDAEDKGDIGG